MEKLALSISNFHSGKSTYRDFIDLVDIKKIQDCNKNSCDIAENINFSNLDSQQMVVLLEKNDKLKNDFFKYGLYQSLDDGNLNIILNKIKIPFSAIENFVDFLVLKEDSMIPMGNKLVSIFNIENF